MHVDLPQVTATQDHPTADDSASFLARLQACKVVQPHATPTLAYLQVGLACAIDYNRALERDWNYWAAAVPSGSDSDMPGELMTTGRVAEYIRSNWNFEYQNSFLNFNATDPFDVIETDPDSVKRFMTSIANYSTQYIELCLTNVPLESSNCSWTCTA